MKNLLFIVGIFLLTTILGCRKDDPEPEPKPEVQKPYFRIWASPESVAYMGIASIIWINDEKVTVQVGATKFENTIGGSVDFPNLQRDTSVFCSIKYTYKNKLMDSISYVKIKVGPPPVVVPKTAKDTLMSMYWMLVEETIRSSNRVDTVNLSEAEKTNKLYFRSENVEIFNKNGVMVGRYTYSIKEDSLKIGSRWSKYLLEKSILSLITASGKDTLISRHVGYMD